MTIDSIYNYYLLNCINLTMYILMYLNKTFQIIMYMTDAM